VSIKPILKFGLLVILAVMLSMTTVIFGALPMRALRRVYGRWPFWVAFASVSAGVMAWISPSYGLLVLSLAVGVGAYAEIEDHGLSVFVSGFVASLAAIGTTILGVGAWIHFTKVALVDSVRRHLEPLVDKLVAMNGGSSISVEAVMQQLPSGIIIGLIAALAIALIGESWALRWIGEEEKARVPQSQLSSFRVPDLFIWLTIVSIFGAFFQHGIKWVETISLNALNVLVVIFFFQGLAVVSHAFRVYRVSPFWQGLWYIIFVIQLFLVVSFVGFVDYWIEFRERLSRKPAETKKGI